MEKSMNDQLNKKIREAFTKSFTFVADGTVEIKVVAAVPGDTAMILFLQKEHGNDPFSTSEAMDIIQDIRNEVGIAQIAVFPWNDDPAIFIRTILTPVQFEVLNLDEKEKMIEIKVKEGSSEEIMQREGKTLLALAQELSGWKITQVN